MGSAEARATPYDVERWRPGLVVEVCLARDFTEAGTDARAH
jgi:hypothetical protein